jgi:DNA-directed RNA polymerase subunit beta'
LIDINDFDYIKIGLASTKDVHAWSSGEVTKPETINYRTLKPEKDGLFCERIFGPTKDWECYCGKYKRVRYKGIICERCGVEVTRQKVRRERMGHIDLAAPVSHIWFFKGVPSRIGYLLDIAPKELEKVLYFAAHICTHVDDAKRLADLSSLEAKVVEERTQLGTERAEEIALVEERLQRRREFFISGNQDAFDDDDEYWARMLAAWAEEQVFDLAEARGLASGLLRDVAARIGGEDPKKVRELVHNAAVRDDRKLTPKELDAVTAAAEAILTAAADTLDGIENGKGTAKGNARKQLERLISYLAGDDAATTASDASILEAVHAVVAQKELDKVRGLGNGLLSELIRDAAEHRTEEGYDLRASANDLCLKADGKMTRDDHRQIEAWALKVREMVQEINQRRKDTDELYDERLVTLDQAWEKFRDIEPKEVVGDEKLARELKDRFGSEFGFGEYIGLGMGAQAIRDLLQRENLDELTADLRDQIATSKGQKQQRAIKRLKVVEAFRKSENRPEWMILDAIPVIPPELRPMVQLDGGRFATSDLNDLYRRVINRNNRLKRLLDLGAPEIIVNNEKRMLQEAVDALFDNGRRGRAVTGPGNRPLKSLSDMLKGKQGRFRQNLLGKRVDYSGRSVIVAGPHLKLHQCGLPKLMALELFKPFIMSRLVERKEVQNIKAAKKMVDSMVPSVWDVLEEVISEHPVLLNRAPTLHRLGIQAFEPQLVEGKAIQVHPLVCSAFNADFDGDQMAVHLPLSVEAQAEARILMLSANNILSPANGRPLATPSQDMVIGLYYLTHCTEDLVKLAADAGDRVIPRFGSNDEVELAYDHHHISLQQPIWVRRADSTRTLTTAGRAIFNHEVRLALAEVLERDPAELTEDDIREINAPLTKREMNDYITWLVDQHGATQVAGVLDTIKELGFRFATKSGVTVSKNDIVTPPDKEKILASYEGKVTHAEQQYLVGLITAGERKERVERLWNAATDEVGEAMQRNLYELNPVFMMANSGARGSFKQIRQLAGMRGLMANPKGEIIERPIRSNFMEGLSVLEYFISTHGARKGLADTALRTADSGYLTRRLVDVSQDVIVRQRDCGTDNYVDVPAFVLDRKVFFDFRGGKIEARGAAFAPRPNDQLVGRVLARDIETSEGLLPAGTPISRDLARAINEAKLETVQVLINEFAKAKLSDPVKLAERLGLADLAAIFKQESSGEDPFLPMEAVDDLRTPEKFLRRMEEDGYVATELRNRSKDDVKALQLRTLAWALNDKIERDCTVPVRSVLTCESEVGVCGACYGLSLANGERSDVGDAVGIIAAQSIGEPGTQLTMRTFHTGGVAGLDITQGLPRVVELFEARTPKAAGAVSHILGRVTNRTKTTGEYVFVLPRRADVEVREIEGEGSVIFYCGERMTRQLHEWLTRGVQHMRLIEPAVLEGQIVNEGQPVLPGVLAPTDLMASGVGRATRYLVEQVQQVYRAQGVEINDKHIEVIARQMTRRVLVDHAGTTSWLPGQYVEVAEYYRTRARMTDLAAADASVEVPTGDRQILGITKASLATESFLSAASFQETTKVLTDAAIEGKIDRLIGLKENVIIGKLIPAATGLREYRGIEIAPRDGYGEGLLNPVDDDYDSLSAELAVTEDDHVPLEGLDLSEQGGGLADTE